jgi:hypothetical protein
MIIGRLRFWWVVVEENQYKGPISRDDVVWALYLRKGITGQCPR